jgi:aspartate racemase
MSDTKPHNNNNTATSSLGVLGLGSRSTLFYIEQLNAGHNKIYGGAGPCPLQLLNSNFDEINRYLPDQWLYLEPVLTKYLHALSDLSVAQIIIPNITLHECYDRLHNDPAISALNIIHPVSSTIRQLQNANCQKVVLFGSLYSMQSPALHKQFSDCKIDIIRPQANDMLAIDNLRQLIYAHKETLQDVEQFNTLLTHYRAQAPVVIACTELSIALRNTSADIYDMARIQINQALQAT